MLIVVVVVATRSFHTVDAPVWGFGKNKISFHLLRWRLHRTEHLEIYYYPEESARVVWVARFAEAAYRRIVSATFWPVLTGTVLLSTITL